MGRMSLGCCSSSGPAPSASAASLAIRLWDPRVSTHPSLSSLSDSCWTSSTSRSPLGHRPRGDTGCVERSAVGTRPRLLPARRSGPATARTALHVDVYVSFMTEERLTPAQLRRELRRIAWGQVRLAQKLGVWPSEVRDWLAGKEPVPEVVALDIRHLPSHNLRPPWPA